MIFSDVSVWPNSQAQYNSPSADLFLCTFCHISLLPVALFSSRTSFVLSCFHITLFSGSNFSMLIILKLKFSQYFINLFTGRKTSSQVFYKNTVLKHFAKFLGKDLFWRLFLIKLQPNSFVKYWMTTRGSSKNLTKNLLNKKNWN